MALQLILQTTLYSVFVPAFLGSLGLSISKLSMKHKIPIMRETQQNIEKYSVMALHLTTFLLILSQLMLIYIMLIVDESFEIVVTTSAEWMTVGERISAAWANRWGSYHLWTLITWLCFSFLIKKLYYLNEEESKLNRLKFFEILAWSSVLILFLLLGQRPYRINEGGISPRGLTPSLLSIWNLLHPPLAFGSYTGYFLSWVIGSYIWIYKPHEDNKFAKYLYRFDKIVTKWTWLLTSLVLVLGMIWSHEATWGGYWNWDAVQVLAVVLWLLSGYRLHIGSKSSNKPLYLLMGIFGFTIVFMAAWIITSNIMGGLHSYANSPIAPLFLILASFTMFPFLFTRKNRWKVSSPVITIENFATPTGLNIGYLAFNFLILGNLMVIVLSLVTILFEIDYNFGGLYPFINSLGILGVTIGLLLDIIQNNRVNKRYIGLSVIVAIVFFLVNKSPLLTSSVLNFAKSLFICTIYITILLLLLSEITRFKRKNAQWPKLFSHVGMLLVFTVIIANGAGPAVSTQKEVSLGIGASWNENIRSIQISLLEYPIAQKEESGTNIQAILQLNLKDTKRNITLSIVNLAGYSPYLQSNWTYIEPNLELFISFNPSAPLKYLGPVIVGVNIIIEFYSYGYNLWIGLYFFLLIPITKIKREKRA